MSTRIGSTKPEGEDAAVGERRPRRQLGVVTRACDGGCLPAVGLSGLDLAAPDARLAGRQEHAGAQRRRVASRGDRVSRARQCPDRVVVCEELVRAVGSLERVVHRARQHVGGTLERVVGDLCVRRKWPGRPLQRLRHPAVQGAAGLVGELAIEHLAKECMPEAPLPALRTDHAGAGRVGETRGDPGGVALGGGDEQRQIDHVAGDGRQIQQRSRLPRQPVEALANDLPDPLRHLARHDRGRALLVAKVHHLVEKERVALGAVEDSRLHVRLDLAGALAHESRRRPAIEPRHRQRRSLAADARQKLARLCVHPGLDVPVGSQQHDPHRPQLAGHEMQQRQRRPIRRVQIVEHQRQRLELGGLMEERAGRPPESEAPFIGRRRRLPAEVGHPRPHLGHELPEEARAVTQRLPEGAVPEHSGQLGQQIEPGPVGRCAAGLPAAPPEDLESPTLRRRGDAVGEAGLADPRLAHQHQEPPASAGGPLQRAGGLADFPFAPDERSSPLRRHDGRKRERSIPGPDTGGELTRTSSLGWRSAARRHMLRV